MRVARVIAHVALVAAAAPFAYAQSPTSSPAKPADAKAGEAKADETAKPDAEKAAEDGESKAGAEAPASPGGVPDTQSAAMQTYQRALEKRRLAATTPLTAQRLRDELAVIEDKIVAGRRDEAIGDLVYIIESPRFGPFENSPEGRTARFLLGDALGRAGAHDLARGYLVKLLDGDPNDTSYRQAVHTLIDLGLESDRPRAFLEDLKKVPPTASDELRGDIAYLAGRAAEFEKKPEEALAQYSQVKERSRFWAQATYLSGVVEVERKNYKEGERLFCKLADPKKTPRQAALFGGGDFFRVRDLARLGLGRVAHEQYRFDDARYYYYLVPQDSERLPEALYETATTRYEAKDYDGARQSMDDLTRLQTNHPYEDEAWILDAYIDLAVCRFPQADRKLGEFLKRYEPVRDAARRLASDEQAMKRLTETLRTGGDPASAGLGVPDSTARALGSLLRIDSGYGRATLRLAELDYQVNGLLHAMSDLDNARQRMAGPKALAPQAAGPMGQSDAEQLARVESQLAEVRRLLRQAEAKGTAKSQLESLRQDLAALEVQARAARAAGGGPIEPAATGPSGELEDLLGAERTRATELWGQAVLLREEVEKQQLGLAKDAFERVDKRLTRLLRRARLGRVETVLGKKRSLEIEVEALSQGLLPQTIVDSLDAARHLGDDEEYWPFEGEDWEDEYVGGEGVR
jgi:tetratricopeptide (TPR) repeat protein